ncbi:MAG: NAD-dependent deacylase [Asgard group archaeon]|nr:NAD-dependent deacylase [Asgard group archaeon]
MNIDSVVEKLELVDHSIVSVIGAGISKASGMPTFRGEDGLWNQYRAEDLATPYAFARDPKLVWEWYRARMRILLNAKPNPAHIALKKLEKANLATGVITQNVDGLHEIAGIKNYVEIHGRIRYARCTSCSHIERWDKLELAQKDMEPPLCSECKENLLRPDVVWFGETLESNNWSIALDWTLQAQILLIIGTSGIVHPVASLPYLAKRNESVIIEFNIEKTPISDLSDYSIYGPCEKTLPEFVDKIIQKVGRSDGNDK